MSYGYGRWQATGGGSGVGPGQDMSYMFGIFRWIFWHAYMQHISVHKRPLYIYVDIYVTRARARGKIF